MKNVILLGFMVFLTSCSTVLAQEADDKKQDSDKKKANDARLWTDSTGHYKIKADLIARDETQIVLQKEDKSLLMVQIAQLSDKDKKFVESKKAEDGEKQSWTLANGLKINGNAVEYGRRDVTIKKKRAKIYVNDRVFENLPEVYQRMVPKIVGHFEKKKIENKTELSKWIRLQKGVPKTFVCDGVMIEFENGDIYGIPIFFFSEKDQAVLNPGLKKYIATFEAEKMEGDEKTKQQEDYNLQLQAQTAARQQEQSDFQQFARLQLQLQGYTGGLFDIWEVQLFPPNNYGYPVVVVVPGRDSRQASVAALQQYPNFRVGAVRKVRRRY